MRFLFRFIFSLVLIFEFCILSFRTKTVSRCQCKYEFAVFRMSELNIKLGAFFIMFNFWEHFVSFHDYRRNDKIFVAFRWKVKSKSQFNPASLSSSCTNWLNMIMIKDEHVTRHFETTIIMILNIIMYKMSTENSKKGEEEKNRIS